MKEIIVKPYQSPCGELLLGSFGDGLCLCDWTGGKRHEWQTGHIRTALQADFRCGDSAVLDTATRQLDEYFDRRRTAFDIPLIFTGTDFQNKVWNILRTVPYGTTLSYRRLAEKVGDPKATRAVAGANAVNPLSVFVPCHRIIGSDNKLVGYGGGLAAKSALLETEGIILFGASAIYV